MLYSYLPRIPSPTRAALRTAAALREQLRVAYERMMRINHAHLNYIKVRVGKGPRGGASLLAVHEYFGRYTLSIGPTAREITDWINDNRDDLKAANITRVGVAAKDDFAGESFFDLDK